MARFVPDFILDKYKNSQNEGSFNGFALFCDMSGFTKVTEQLSTLGSEGEEILTDILNSFYSPAVKVIEKYGGFVSTFAGDAFTGIFPHAEYEDIKKMASELSMVLKRNSIKKTKAGKFVFSFKIGVGYGNIKWQIVRTRTRSAYFFYGDAIREAAANEEEAEKGSYVLPVYNASTASGRIKNETYVIDSSLERRFYPREILSGEVESGFRTVIPVFINVKKDRVLEVVRDILELGKNAYLNKVDFGDKGYVVMVIFGAPFARENDIEDALTFVNGLRDKHRESIKVGLVFAKAFAGIVGSRERAEYTVMGKGINLAARLMQAADFGEIFTDDKIKQIAERYFRFEEKAAIKPKGFSNYIKVYALKSRMFEITPSQHTFIYLPSPVKKLVKSVVQAFARKRKGFFVGVYGPIGTGKTLLAGRIVGEIKNNMPIARFIYLKLSGDEFYTSDRVVVDFLRFFLEYDRGEEFAKSKLTAYINAVRQVDRKAARILSLNASVLLSFISGRNLSQSIYSVNKLAEVFVQFLSSYSLLNPVVLVIDSLENADEFINLVLNKLNPVVKEHALFVIMTSRDIIPESEFVIETKPFSREQTVEFLKGYLGEEPHSRLIEYVYGVTKGIPHYIVAILKYLDSLGLIVRSGGIVYLKDSTKELAPEVSHIMLSQLDETGSIERKIAEYAAIIGTEFSISTLEYVSGFSRKLLIKGLESLREYGILRQISMEKYAFANDMLQESIYGSILKKSLRRIHRKVLKYYLKRGISSYSELYEVVRHAHGASVKSKVLLWGEKALDVAISRYHNKVAIKVSDILLSYLRPESRKYFEILLKKATAQIRYGYVEEAMNTYNAVLNGAKGSTRAWALYRLSSVYDMLGKKENSLILLKESLSIYRKLRNHKGLASVYLNMGVALMGLRKNKEAERKLLRALYHAKKAGIPDLMAKVHLNLGILHSRNPLDGKMHFEEAVRYYRDTNDKTGLARAYMNLGVTYLRLGDTNRSIKMLERARLIISKYEEHTPFLSGLYNTLSVINLRLGHFRRAVKYLQLALKVAEDAMDIKKKAMVYNNLAVAHLSLGHRKKAMYYAGLLETIIKDIDDVLRTIPFLLTIAEVWLANGEFEKTVEISDRVISFYNNGSCSRYDYIEAMLIKAESLLESGSKRKALKILEKLGPVDEEELILKRDYLFYRLGKKEVDINYVLKEAERIWHSTHSYAAKRIKDFINQKV